MKEKKLFCGLWVTAGVELLLSAGQEIKISHSGVRHLSLCQNLRTDPCAAWPLLREAEWHFTGCTPNVLWKSFVFLRQTVFLLKKHFRRPTSLSVSPAVVYTHACASMRVFFSSDLCRDCGCVVLKPKEFTVITPWRVCTWHLSSVAPCPCQLMHLLATAKQCGMLAGWLVGWLASYCLSSTDKVPTVQSVGSQETTVFFALLWALRERSARFGPCRKQEPE